VPGALGVIVARNPALKKRGAITLRRAKRDWRHGRDPIGAFPDAHLFWVVFASRREFPLLCLKRAD